MSIVTIHSLADSSLCLDAVRNERAGKVAAMAHALIDNRCFADHSDSIMVLVKAGFSAFKVKVLIDDARQVASQHVVAMEMAWS